MPRSSERTILICEECGERLVIAGPKDIWCSEQAIFECECGETHLLTARQSRNDTSTEGQTTSELPALGSLPDRQPDRRSA